MVSLKESQALVDGVSWGKVTMLMLGGQDQVQGR